MLLLAALASCSNEKTDVPATTVDASVTAADSTASSQPAEELESLEVQTAKTSQEIDSLLEGI